MRRAPGTAAQDQWLDSTAEVSHGGFGGCVHNIRQILQQILKQGILTDDQLQHGADHTGSVSYRIVSAEMRKPFRQGLRKTSPCIPRCVMYCVHLTRHTSSLGCLARVRSAAVVKRLPVLPAQQVGGMSEYMDSHIHAYKHTYISSPRRRSNIACFALFVNSFACVTRRLNTRDLMRTLVLSKHSARCGLCDSEGVHLHSRWNSSAERRCVQALSAHSCWYCWDDACACTPSTYAPRNHHSFESRDASV